MAVAVENTDRQANGVIAFYTLDDNGNATFHKEVPAGALPDSVAFTPNGVYLLAANEGEPSGDYTNDPEGSVTIIPITNGVAADTGTQVRFTDFNNGGSRANELGDDVRISHPNATVSQDLEPEFITSSADSTTAYVSLQENNALAVIDIANGTVTAIFGLGFKDHSVVGNGLDPSDRDGALNGGIHINTFANLKGLYMPDALASFSQDGMQYVLTANEGDVREYFFAVADEAACNAAGGLDFDDDDGCLSWIDATRVDDLNLDATAFPNASTLQQDDNQGRLNALTTQGDTDGDGDHDTIFAFGGRSFSLWNGDTGALVFDSGDDFERITAVALGTDGFNTTDDENAFDNRSDDKGPEPEALAIGQVGDKRYVFIGLERTSGIMVYDITDPVAPMFGEYVTNRNYTVDIANNLAEAGDLAPEGRQFVSAEHSPTGNALLIVGYEVSGTVAVYEVK